MKKSIYLVLCLILFFIFLNKFSFAEENMLTIKQQIDRLQREVNDLSKSVFKNPNQSNANSKDQNDNQTVNFTAIDMRIYDLEKDIKNLTMNLEELIFQLDEINNKIYQIEEDFISKLQSIVVEKSKENLNNINKKEDSNVENPENVLGTLIITSENNTEVSNQKDKVEETNENQLNSDLQKLSPEEKFQIAFDQIRNKKYDEAKLSLQTFIDQNSENQLSGSAHYWLGELYLLEKNYREAALILAEGYQNYQKSIKAPNMLYKLSEALIEIGRNEQACNTLSKLSKDFSSHKLKNKAEKKKLEISCNISE